MAHPHHGYRQSFTRREWRKPLDSIDTSTQPSNYHRCPGVPSSSHNVNAMTPTTVNQVARSTSSCFTAPI